MGRQADADRTDDRGLHARPDVRDARHRPQRRPRARRRAAATCWRPSAASPARSTSSATPPATSRSPAIFALLAEITGPPRAALPRALRAGVVQRRRAARAWRASPAGRPRVPLTAVRMARKRMYFSPAKAVRELGLPQTDVRPSPCRTPSRGSRRTATRARRGRMSLGSLSASLTRKSRSNFYYAFLSLPRARRDALYAVYAFCRTVDDVADLGHDPRRPARGARALADGRRAVLRAGAGPDASDRAAAARRGARLPDPPRGAGGDHRRRARWISIACGTSAPRTSIRTATAWPRRSVSAASRSSATPTRAPASTPSQLGTALQLTNIIRDVGADARDGRVYLPQQDLKEFGVTEDDLVAGRYDERFVRLMEHQAARAREFYAAAARGVPRGRRALAGAGRDHGTDLPGAAGGDRGPALPRLRRAHHGARPGARSPSRCAAGPPPASGATDWRREPGALHARGRPRRRRPHRARPPGRARPPAPASCCCACAAAGCAAPTSPRSWGRRRARRRCSATRWSATWSRPAGRRAAASASGDRVVAAHHVPCGGCHYCRRGSESMCREFKISNLDPGGFAEYVRVPAPNVRHATFRIPDHLSDEEASFVEPLACCLRAVDRARVEPGDTVVVIGLGSIGCLFTQLLKRAGAVVVGVDPVAERAALARARGADVTGDAETRGAGGARAERGARRRPRHGDGGRRRRAAVGGRGHPRRRRRPLLRRRTRATRCRCRSARSTTAS